MDERQQAVKLKGVGDGLWVTVDPSPVNLFSRFSKKMILPVTTSLPKKESKKAASLKPSIPGDLKSSSTHTRTCKQMLSLFYQKNIPTLGVTLVSMVP